MISTPTIAQAEQLLAGTSPFVFITGCAGTGKSTLLRHYRENSGQKAVYLAPTGVAALNIEGETIHKFFHFTPGITSLKARRMAKHADIGLLKALDTIIIDEISMVRADIIEYMDIYLRTALASQQPFGGKRIRVFGDLYQLSPVVPRHEHEAFHEKYVTPYFFSADVIKGMLMRGDIQFVELDKVFRQESDPDFLRILAGIRRRSITADDLALLNSRVTDDIPDENILRLTTTNAEADACNLSALANLETASRTYTGKISGEFPEKDLPTDLELTLKVGARVMCVKNDTTGNAYVNGSLGVIEELEMDYVLVKLDTGRTVQIAAVPWTLYKSQYDIDSGELDQKHVGSFTQIPLRLAWATTIHKSQGKTFDNVCISLARGAFATGQVYVALSRCRTMNGITLTHPVTMRSLLVDERVHLFIDMIRDRKGMQVSLLA